MSGITNGEKISELLNEIKTYNIKNIDKQIEVMSWIDNKKSSDSEFIENLIKEINFESTYIVGYSCTKEGFIKIVGITKK